MNFYQNKSTTYYTARRLYRIALFPDKGSLPVLELGAVGCDALVKSNVDFNNGNRPGIRNRLTGGLFEEFPSLQFVFVSKKNSA